VRDKDATGFASLAQWRTRLAVVALITGLTGSCAPVVIAPGPAVTTPALQADRLVTADGTGLALRSWLPADGAPRAAIIALHGFNDYGNFIADAADYLAGRGIATYAYDQRGFGETPARGMWPGVEALVDDLRVMTERVRARHPATPLYLLGASMGGAVIMVAMTSPKPPAVDGLVISGPAVWGRATMPFYQRWSLALAAHTVPWLTLTGRGLGILASDNIEMLRALGRDPLVIKETRVDTIYGLVNLMDAAFDAAPSLQTQALILYGENDEVIPKEPTELMIASLPAAAAGGRQRLALYAKGYHMLLRDLQAETVWRDIVGWIEHPAQPLASGADSHAREKRRRR
jgi:alpha-beta hydrolase superfamily lysophospholipase